MIDILHAEGLNDANICRTLNLSEEQMNLIRTRDRSADVEIPSGLALAAVGRKHFGNPIPREWYDAARELIESIVARGWVEPDFSLESHLYRQGEFSERTFGPGPRPDGIVDHIQKELREILASPDDLEEWIDVAILAFDGALRAGHSPRKIITALVAKQTKNECREWPDWRTATPGKAIEHVRPSPPRPDTVEVSRESLDHHFALGFVEACGILAEKPFDQPTMAKNIVQEGGYEQELLDTPSDYSGIQKLRDEMKDALDALRAQAQPATTEKEIA